MSCIFMRQFSDMHVVAVVCILVSMSQNGPASLGTRLWANFVTLTIMNGPQCHIIEDSYCRNKMLLIEMSHVKIMWDLQGQVQFVIKQNPYANGRNQITSL